MCGIFFCIYTDSNNEYKLFNNIKHRGPDYSTFYMHNDLCYGFHRLGIINPKFDINQPFINNNIVVLCNGEIYNWKQLIRDFDLPKKDYKSDCEILIYLYEKLEYNFYKMVSLLDGEFAIILHDLNKSRVFVARDFMGIRPLYFSKTKIASELKAFNTKNPVQHIIPRNIYEFIYTKTELFIVSMESYWNLDNLPIPTKQNSRDHIINEIYKLLNNSVKDRLVSDKPIGCLLSGGLDSSIIVSLASKVHPNISCFTIGLENSPDVINAKLVAKFLKVPLFIIPFDINNAINYIPEVIWHLETYDITTVRASTPQFLIAKWIKENTNIKVVLSGEGSDELFSGYLYSKLAPTTMDLYNDGIRLLKDLYLFDCLRTDRTIASSGLEVRVPFLNKQLVEFVLKEIDPSLRVSDNNQMEKQLLRDMAKKYDLLPIEIIQRRKEAFSDAVSDNETTWYKQIQHKIYPIEEKIWYKNIFVNFFSNQNILPYYWMPKWSNTKDPSATTLSIY